MAVESVKIENKVVVLAGLPTGFIKYTLDKGFNGLVFEELTVEKLKELLNKADKIILAVRHEPTKKLLLELIEDKNKVEEKLIVTNEELMESDRIIVAPNELKERGKDIEVSWDDLVIIAFYPALKK